MSRESSAVNYLDSKQAEIERLMRVGDAGEHDLKRINKPVVKPHSEQEKELIKKVLDLRNQGLPWEEVAEQTPWRMITLKQLLQRRGVFPKSKTFNDPVRRAAIEKEARHVNSEARRIGSLRAALNASSLTDDQYHQARGRLKLPSISRKKKHLGLDTLQ